MPTLPLLTEPPNPNGSHRLLAPGGYEGWSFDASSDDGALHLVASLHAADALDAEYARAYARYRRRPTRVAPPLPGDFAAVTFALFEKGRQPVRFAVRGVAAGEVLVAPTGDSVRIGGSHAIRSPDGRTVQLNLRGVDDGRTIAVNLAFRSLGRVDREVTLLGDAPTVFDSGGGVGDPRHRAAGGGHPAGDPARGVVASAARDAGLHRWVVADPVCDVNGEIAVFDGTGGPPRTVPLAGSGFCEHAYGTRPMAEAARRWFAGRAIFEDRVIAFRRAGHRRRDVHLVTTEFTAAPTPAAGSASVTTTVATVAPRDEDVSHDHDFLRHGDMDRIDPDRVDLGPLHLEYPQVLERGKHEDVVVFAASAGDQRGTALCRVLRPPTARSRFLW